MADCEVTDRFHLHENDSDTTTPQDHSNSQEEMECSQENDDDEDDDQTEPDTEREVMEEATGSVIHQDDEEEEEEDDDMSDVHDQTENQTSGNDEHLKDEGEEEATSHEEGEEETPNDSASATPSVATTENQPQYSTRGRNHTTRGETEIEILREKIPEDDEGERRTAPTTSFLDSLGEEERRSRTRFLPNVDGFHALYKSEIKHDIKLARTIVSSNGLSSKLNSKCKPRREDEDSIKNEEEEMLPAEEASSSDGPDSMTSGHVRDVIISKAFVVPPDDEIANSPHVIETMTAFNPPRHPESVESKKKHRMMRWERKPHEVDMDLASYRKTVARTRQELMDAQAEREKMESVSAHLRSHFLKQLNALEEEGTLLNNEFFTIQQDCVKAANLPHSKTRSRGSGKGNHGLKDALQVLKQRGTEAVEQANEESASVKSPMFTPIGIGGIPAKAFFDWERGQKLQKASPASSWILVGQVVKTPYGSGQVVKVFAPAALNINEPPISRKVKQKADHGFRLKDDVATNCAFTTSPKESEKGKMLNNAKIPDSGKTIVPINCNDGFLAARVCVRLSYGVAFLPLDSISINEDVSLFSDQMLVDRWKAMTDSALSVAGCVDLSAMVDYNLRHSSLEKMDVDDSCSDSSADDTIMKIPEKSYSISPFLPYGSDMLPTSAGRATGLADISIDALKQGLQVNLFTSCKVLGDKSNKGIPAKFREWEDIRDELSLLRAQVLQRRNELARQRRLRVMNERILVMTNEKSSRVKTLVSEMRADLKSLRERLDCELLELGIDGEKAEQLLTAHFREVDRLASFESHAEANPSASQGKRRELEKSRRSGFGLSPDEDLDDRPSSKRTRASQ